MTPDPSLDDEIAAEIIAYRSNPPMRKRQRGITGTEKRRRSRLRDKLVAEQSNRCHYCDREMARAREFGSEVDPLAATLEHLVEWHEGGETSPENCVAACHRCNHARGALLLRVRQLEVLLTHPSRVVSTHYAATKLEAQLEAWIAFTKEIDHDLHQERRARVARGISGLGSDRPL